MGECSRPARSIAPPVPPSPSTHAPRQPAVRPASTRNNTSLRPPARRNTGGGSTLAWRARALGRPGWPPTAISCYVFPAQPGPAVSAMAWPATTAACEEWPCGERRGIAGGATPHLVLSSTLEPLRARWVSAHAPHRARCCAPSPDIARTRHTSPFRNLNLPKTKLLRSRVDPPPSPHLVQGSTLGARERALGRWNVGSTCVWCYGCPSRPAQLAGTARSLAAGGHLRAP